MEAIFYPGQFDVFRKIKVCINIALGGTLWPKVCVLKECEYIGAHSAVFPYRFPLYLNRAVASACFQSIQSSRRMLRTNRAFRFHQSTPSVISHRLYLSFASLLSLRKQILKENIWIVSHWTYLWRSPLNKKFLESTWKTLRGWVKAGKGAAGWWWG